MYGSNALHIGKSVFDFSFTNGNDIRLRVLTCSKLRNLRKLIQKIVGNLEIIENK